MASVDELSKKYSSQLSQLRSIFPTWDEGDLVFTLQDAKGNLEEAAVAITEGRASQFTQATKKKPVKTAPPQGKGYSNRNADTGGWENVNGGDSAGRGGRGGRGGSRGARGGRGGEPFRGGRGGRGGARGGRGGFANVNGGAPGKKTNGYPTSTATTTEGWANQVEQAKAADDGDEAGWSTAADGASAVKADAEEGSSSEPPVEASKADDFSAAGGLSDAPAPKELEAAVKHSAPAPKPKLTWAQIAKPAEKPKPAPPPPAAKEPEPPVPVTTEEPTTENQSEVPAEVTEETPAETTEALGDAPAEEELEAQAGEITEEYPNGEAEVQAEEPAQTAQDEDAWGVDPAIAGSGAQAAWADQASAAAEPAPTLAPEPITTYTGPPGFNVVAAKAAVASQPRASSRAGRFKNADGQGVVLPASVTGVSAMEMQFGSLSFGGQGGDGVEAPVQEPETPAQAAPAPAQQVASPVRAPQPIAPVQPPHIHSSQLAPSAPSQPVTAPSAQPQPSAPAPQSTHPYYSQQQQQQPSQQPGQPPATQQQQGGYTAPHQTLQQQMSNAYASQFGQQQQQPQAPAQDQTQQSFYRGQQDYYNSYGSQGQQQPLHPQHQQQQQQQQQPQPHQSDVAGQQSQQPPSSQPQHHTSPYETGFGGFGGSHQAAQSQQQPQHTTDTFGAAQRAYDSYNASGYPRPPIDEPKQAAPAPSHTPTAPSQPQQGLPHQSQYYQQLNNMGYYQAAPYNPYYQYGQAPQPGFQQYYPLASRNGLYGQPNPQAPPAPPIQANKPSPAPAHSPYGGPSPYPSSTYDEQSSLNVGRYGESKPQGAAQPAQAGAYQSQGTGLHNFLGMNTPSAASTATTRPSASTPDESFKSQTSAATSVTGGVSGQGPQRTTQHGQQANQQLGGFGGYPYGNAAAGYGNQDWSQYGGQHYGSRNGYSQWQQ